MNINKKKPRYVFVIKRDGKPYRYMARVTVKFMKIYLGCYKTQGEAVRAVEIYLSNPDAYAKRIRT